MFELEKLHTYHLSLLAFLSIACKSMHELIWLYITKNSPDYDISDSEEKSFSKFIQCLQTNYEGLFKALDVVKYPPFIKTMFTDDSKQILNAEICFRKLDITAIGDILENTPYFPSCKNKHRKNLICMSSIHKSHCCASCNGKHLCSNSSCGKSKCKGICCISSTSCCDHECINCSAKSSECYSNSTVCCKSCGTCLQCMMETVLIKCPDRDIREVITLIISLRNLVAHSNEVLWEELDNGTFCSADFPNCPNWKRLSKSVFDNIEQLLRYLKIEGTISTEEYEVRKYHLNQVVQLQKEELLKKFSNQILVEANQIMLCQSTKKSLYLKFEVELPNNQLPRKALQLNGEVMNSICKVTKQIIMHETEAVSESIINIQREKCEVVYPQANVKALKVKLIVEPRDFTTEAKLFIFKTPVSPASLNLWEILSDKIKSELKDGSLGIDADVWQEQWKLGSIIIKVAIVKKNKTIWTADEIDFLLLQRFGLTDDLTGNVEIHLIAKKEEPLQHLKLKVSFKVHGIDSVSMEAMEMIKEHVVNILHQNVDAETLSITNMKVIKNESKEFESINTDLGSFIGKKREMLDDTIVQADSLKSVINVATSFEQTAITRRQQVYAAANYSGMYLIKSYSRLYSESFVKTPSLTKMLPFSFYQH